MILFSTPGEVAIVLPTQVAVEYSSAAMVYQSVPGTSPPIGTNLEGFEGELAQIQPHVEDVSENFDWSKPKTYREFVRLEQKVLARKVNSDERNRYELMKKDRNSIVFADRCVRDYAEVQRLKKLSEKLTEIQQYLRPIEI
jgi:hypothetical protein